MSFVGDVNNQTFILKLDVFDVQLKLSSFVRMHSYANQ